MRYFGKIKDPKDLVTKEYVDTKTEGLTTFWFGTRAEYNSLPVIDPDVCYCIQEGT